MSIFLSMKKALYVLPLENVLQATVKLRYTVDVQIRVGGGGGEINFFMKGSGMLFFSGADRGF